MPFSAPAGVTESFPNAIARRRFGTRWNQVMTRFFRDAISSAAATIRSHERGTTGKALWFERTAGAGAGVVGVSWAAFPKQVREAHGGRRPEMWAAAERLATISSVHFVTSLAGGPVRGSTRAFQDEYVEWFAPRDASGRITRVDVTCETPEYWMHLAMADPDGLAARYEAVLGHPVPAADLFFPGPMRWRDQARGRMRDGYLVQAARVYNPFNRWNTTDGAVHLTQRVNSLSMEVGLAALASARRSAYPVPSDDPAGFVTCAAFGSPERDSDPVIGVTVNNAVRSGLVLTLTDPVAVYITDLAAAELALPNGTRARPGRVTLPPGADDLATWWRVVRGTAAGPDGKARILRASFAPPAGATIRVGGATRPLTVSDLYSHGVPVSHGAAVVEEVTMGLYASAWPAAAGRPVVEIGCGDGPLAGPSPMAASAGGAVSGGGRRRGPQWSPMRRA
jgi:hypothetical protein